MYYYTAIIVSIISIFILGIGLLLDRRSRTSKVIVTYIICSIWAVYLCWNSRTMSNLRLHEKMIKAESVIINEKQVTINYTNSDVIWFSRMSDAPVYVQQQDILTEVPLTFLSEGKKIHATLLTISDKSKYPDEAIIEFNDKYYCIVSNRFLYRNALFFLEKGFVRELLLCYFQE